MYNKNLIASAKPAVDGVYVQRDRNFNSCFPQTLLHRGVSVYIGEKRAKPSPHIISKYLDSCGRYNSIYSNDRRDEIKNSIIKKKVKRNSVYINLPMNMVLILAKICFYKIV